MTKHKAQSTKHKILLVGGSTGGGPVMPLLALVQRLRSKGTDTSFLWLGSNNTLEQQLVRSANISYQTIPSGKLRRYWSWQNLLDGGRVFGGFIAACWYIMRWRPTHMISAGGYSGPPVALACWLYRVPIHIHQQDVVPGLANRCMAVFAASVSVSVEESAAMFKGKQVLITGNMVRHDIAHGDREALLERYHMQPHRPVLLVLGGGQGAAALNELIWKGLASLSPQAYIMHMTGSGKKHDDITRDAYWQKEFLGSELLDWYKAADVIVTRAGMSTLSELAYLGKAAIIIPIPHSHQEKNARYFQRKKAAIVLDQEYTSSQDFAASLNKLLTTKKERENLEQCMAVSMEKNALASVAELLKI